MTNPPRLLFLRGELHDVEALVLDASGDIAVITALGDGSAHGSELQSQVGRQQP